MKKRHDPTNEACEFFDYCTRKEGADRKDCGNCPLYPRASRIFTPTFITQLILSALIYFMAGVLFASILASG